MEHLDQQFWVYDREMDKIVYKQIRYVPGLYRIFGKFSPQKPRIINSLLDEILVNAADNFQRDKTMNLVKVEINPEQNKISVWNNGKGIPVQIHKEHNIYVPEMIFGKPLSSSDA